MECRRWLLLGVLAAFTFLPASCERSARDEHLIPWAWERRTDLRFAGAREIAYLCATIEIRGGGALVIPRMQPLQVDPAARLIPVFRIEARGSAPLVDSAGTVASAIARLASRGTPPLVQIDFDATQSQRVYYSAVLSALRKRLPRKVGISITALTSWCMNDRWLARLPVDEAVPMVFRMGPDGAAIRARLERGQDFLEPLCRSSIGISTDEPLARGPGGRRVYVFHPAAWSAQVFDVVQQEVRQWP